VQEDVLATLHTITPHARALGTEPVLQELAAGVREGYSDAGWLRQVFSERKSLNDVARLQSELWMGHSKVHA
jgi:carboxylate-amine ligase